MAIKQNMKKHERKAVSKRAIITSDTVLIVFAIGGTAILSIFGTTILSFMIAGGCFSSLQELLTHGDSEAVLFQVNQAFSSCFPITRRIWCNHHRFVICLVVLVERAF
ncbi:MAG TPA: MarC family protein [Candidatus Bathyarchaeia archaeon]|nr:MarC family protein [Candidatus Bathyarchaeia archaeon]